MATITGTSVEAAIMGKKALIFGDAWFEKCPNVFTWHRGLTFNEIINEKIYTKEDILKYLKNQMEEYSIPGCQNPSSESFSKNILIKILLKPNLMVYTN